MASKKKKLTQLQRIEAIEKKLAFVSSQCGRLSVEVFDIGRTVHFMRNPVKFHKKHSLKCKLASNALQYTPLALCALFILAII